MLNTSNNTPGQTLMIYFLLLFLVKLQAQVKTSGLCFSSVTTRKIRRIPTLICQSRSHEACKMFKDTFEFTSTKARWIMNYISKREISKEKYWYHPRRKRSNNESAPTRNFLMNVKGIFLLFLIVQFCSFLYTNVFIHLPPPPFL